MLASRRAVVGGVAGSMLARTARGGPSPSAAIRIGGLTDLSGPYRESAGPTSVACTQMAADEAMAAAPGLAVEVVQAAYLQKTDTALAIARAWFDTGGVDVITNCNNSAVALAISSGWKCQVYTTALRARG